MAKTNSTGSVAVALSGSRPSPREFIDAAFARVLAASNRRHVELREAITSLDTSVDLPEFLDDFVKPFQLAVDTKAPRLVAVAVDCVHQLVATGWISNGPEIIKLVSSASKIQDDLVQLQCLKALLTVVSTPECKVHDSSLLEAVRSGFSVYLTTKNGVNASTARAILTQMMSIIFKNMETSLDILTFVNSTAPTLKQPLMCSRETESTEDDPHIEQVKHPRGKYGRCNVCSNTANSYCIQSLDPICGRECKRTNLLARISMSKDDEEKSRFTAALTASQARSDAFVVFRAICKLSARGKSSDPTALKSKTLSLELLLSILDSAGPAFTGSPQFINAVREQLVLSLLSNCVSSDDHVFRLSLSIFVVLIREFRPHLKYEIGMFMHDIFLKLLRSSNSTFEQRLVLIQVFCKMCGDPETIVSLFANYDCDPQCLNCFGEMIQVVDKISRGKLVTEGWITKAQERQLKHVAVQSMVALLKSLLSFHSKTSKKLGDEDPPSTVSDLEECSVASEDVGKPDELEKVNLFEAYASQKRTKELLETGIVKFNIKPKDGMTFLRKMGLLGDSPEDLAKFFFEVKNVSKDQIGDFIGLDRDFNKDVLKTFVARMNFESLEIDQAIRKFFSYFRLPGEGPMIDQIMEAFADHFYEQNPEVYENAHVTFILSYAIIMLNTDLYSRTLKKHMTREDWLLMNSRINSEYRLADDYLLSIYERIAKDEIRINDSSSKTTADSKLRSHKFSKETEEIVRVAHTSMKLKNEMEPYLPISRIDADILRPMFEIVWTSCLASLSIHVQESDDIDVIQEALTGYRHAIRIGSVFSLEVEKQAFVNSLASFTLLGTDNEMKPKNIMATKSLLLVAYYEGNSLDESWLEVLKCISEYERLRLMGTGVNFTKANFREQDSKNSASLEAIEASSIDRIFTRSSSLGSEAIIHFVDHLCSVSRAELASGSPRVFCLQKIVEITFYNMGRIRFVWSQIWAILAVHFEHAGTHSNTEVSLYAVDSLRQLASKFLQKDELSNYDFQKQFLRPFEAIAENPNIEVKEFVVEGISNLVFSCAPNVKSGWRSVFIVFEKMALVRNIKLVVDTYSAVDRLLRDHAGLLTDSLDEVANCLIGFGTSPFTEISLKAIGLLQGTALLVSQRSSPGDGDLKTWFLIFTGLSSLIGDSRIEVRARALGAITAILRSYGDRFNSDTWSAIFRGVLLPLFDDVHHMSNSGGHKERRGSAEDIVSENSWLKTTCIHALESLTEVFCQFFLLSRAVIRDMFNLYLMCMNQPSSDVSGASISCMLRLMETCGGHFSPTEWDSVLKSIHRSFLSTLPHALISDGIRKELGLSDVDMQVTQGVHNIYTSNLNPKTFVEFEYHIEEFSPKAARKSLKKSVRFQRFEPRAVLIRCDVQLRLIDTLEHIIDTQNLPAGALETLLLCLESSVAFTRVFNRDWELRFRLAEKGWIGDMDMYALESRALDVYFRAVSRVCFSSTSVADDIQAQLRIETVVLQMLGEYIQLEQMKSTLEGGKAMACLEPVLCLTFNYFTSLSKEQLHGFGLGKFLPAWIELICAESPVIRQSLKQLMVQHIAPLALR